MFDRLGYAKKRAKEKRAKMKLELGEEEYRRLHNKQEFMYRTGWKEKAYQRLGNRCSNPACQWLNADGTRGCVDRRCLNIDHVFGDGRKHKTNLGRTGAFYKQIFEDTEGRFQILCCNCNWIKRFEKEEHGFGKRRTDY